MSTEPVTFRQWLAHVAGATSALLYVIVAAACFSFIILVSLYAGVLIEDGKKKADRYATLQFQECKQYIPIDTN